METLTKEDAYTRKKESETYDNIPHVVLKRSAGNPLEEYIAVPKDEIEDFRVKGWIHDSE